MLKEEGLLYNFLKIREPAILAENRFSILDIEIGHSSGKEARLT
jgi:hypothetical protein